MAHRLNILHLLALLAFLGHCAGGPPAVAADDGPKLAALAPRLRTPPRPLPAKRTVAKPAADPVVSPAVPVAPLAAPAETSGRQVLNSGAAWGQVNGDRVNVRSGPGTQTHIVTTLRAGDYVRARAIQDGWLEIDWPRSVPAWIGKESVRASAGADGVVSGVTMASATVHCAGHPRATVLAKLDSGARVIIIGDEGMWYKIKAPESAAAFINARYVVTGVTPPAPEAVAPPIAAATPAPQPAPPAPPISKAAAVVQQAPPPPLPAAAQAVPKADLFAAIEETRRELRESAPAKALPLVTAPQPVGTGRAVAEEKQATEAEEQAKRDAENQRLQELETARLLVAAKKAAAEEQARRQAAAERLAAEAKRQAEDQARREAEAARPTPAPVAVAVSVPSAGSFVDPTDAQVAKTQPSEPPAAGVEAAHSEPARTPVPVAPSASAAPEPEPAPAKAEPGTPVPPPPAALSQDETASLATLPETLKRVRSKYIVPSQPPAPPKNRAVVVKVVDDNQETDRAPVASAKAAEVLPEQPPQVLRITAPRPASEPRVPELPKPAGEPPPSHRLKPFFTAQARSLESAENVVAADGLLERRLPSPVAGAEYALVRNGRTLHFLTSHDRVNLEGFVGRRVTVTGVPLPSTASEAPLLEVGSISASE